MFWKPSMCWAQCWAFWRLRCHLRAFRHKDLNMYSPKIFGYNREIFLLSIKHSAPNCYSSSKFRWITEWMEPLVWKLTRELGSNRILESEIIVENPARSHKNSISWKLGRLSGSWSGCLGQIGMMVIFWWGIWSRLIPRHWLYGASQ